MGKKIAHLHRFQVPSGKILYPPLVQDDEDNNVQRGKKVELAHKLAKVLKGLTEPEAQPKLR